MALEKRRDVRVKLTEHDVVAVLANVSKNGRQSERLQTSTSVNKDVEADLVCKEFWEHLLLRERLLPAAVRTFSEIHSFIKSVCAERGQIGRMVERQCGCLESGGLWILGQHQTIYFLRIQNNDLRLS